MKPRTLPELTALIDSSQAMRDPIYMDGADRCHVCGRDMAAEQLLVDGAVHTTDEESAWAILCANCFMAHGIGIRWGAGQLYQRTADSRWLLVAGFPPPE